MMALWSDMAVLGVYTLSPTHCGTGQVTGAVDLPIARDAVTGFPVLPASGIKGVLRDCANNVLKPSAINRLFGPELDRNADDQGLAIGALTFTEARLIAYPARSLTRPFLHVTCPLLLTRLARDLRATGGDTVLEVRAGSDSIESCREGRHALVADESLDTKALVLEDLIYQANEVTYADFARDTAQTLTRLLPLDEDPTRAMLSKGLVIIPDGDFGALMDSAIPVTARVRLDDKKTTNDGSLWYEETLPSDCLFVSLVGERRNGRVNQEENSESPLMLFSKMESAARVIQIGGNETVGQGLCFCTILGKHITGTSSS